ncbi:transcription factor bHLH25-like [Senna tora]|uniref:Transcription factor bHLH25-like n=1 Tax=Senna tora TaxID=362788 RepID=A0A834T5E1_9FABA|nr:transcription factor bHLH25-like [Senna tora]
MEKAIKELEKQNKKAVMMEMNEHDESQPDTTSSCGSNIDGANESLPLPEPEVKARVLEKQILINIHCHKQNGIIYKIMAQLHNLQLSLLSTTVLPFGNFTLDITIIAQMGDESKVTVSGIVQSLREALLM